MNMIILPPPPPPNNPTTLPHRNLGLKLIPQTTRISSVWTPPVRSLRNANCCPIRTPRRRTDAQNIYIERIYTKSLANKEIHIMRNNSLRAGAADVVLCCYRTTNAWFVVCVAAAVVDVFVWLYVIVRTPACRRQSTNLHTTRHTHNAHTHNIPFTPFAFRTVPI